MLFNEHRFEQGSNVQLMKLIKLTNEPRAFGKPPQRDLLKIPNSKR